MTEKIKELHVLLNEEHIGILREESDGKHSFTYDSNYHGMPLSLSMPLHQKPWKGQAVEAYIDGILPDDPSTRQRIGHQYAVNSRNPFALLTAIGLDCSGAVQFLSDDQLADPTILQGSYVSVSEEQIGRRLAHLTGQNAPSWQTNNEHWSLNGAQDKIALAHFTSNQWYEAQGSAATTHIIKPGIHQLHEQAFNEYLCLRTLHELGLPVAESQYLLFGGIPAIVSTRWDRRIKSHSHIVLRLHQEDMCQAMSVSTADKYQSDGGPSAVDIVHFMRSHGFASGSDTLFFSALIANYLLGGTDAHAKNYAILELPDQRPMLAPLYDVASLYPYEPIGKGFRMAMSIGHEYRWDRIELHNWDTFARECGQPDDAEVIHVILHQEAQQLPDLFNAVQHEEMKRLSQMESMQNSLDTKRELIRKIQDNLNKCCLTVLSWFHDPSINQMNI